MITLDEYIEINHKKLSDDIDTHISMYLFDDACADGLHRCIMTSVRQFDKKQFNINKYLKSPELLDLDIEVAMLNEETKGRLLDGVSADMVIGNHTCDLITLILTKLKEIQDNEV